MNKTCTNCQKSGHGFRDCREPVISFGILAFKRINKQIRFLLIQRKDTMGKIDLVRGKYTDLLSLENIIQEMTQKERQDILQLSFNDHWESLWVNKKSRPYIQDKEEAKRKFQALDIGQLFDNTVPSWVYNEWSIPKGRRSSFSEQDINCAKREFQEETGCSSSDICVYMKKDRSVPIVFYEKFTGSNNVAYRHDYFLAEFISDHEKVTVDPSNKQQIGEVSDIGWFSLKETLEMFRSYDSCKKSVVVSAWLYLTGGDVNALAKEIQ